MKRWTSIRPGSGSSSGRPQHTEPGVSKYERISWTSLRHITGRDAPMKETTGIPPPLPERPARREQDRARTHGCGRKLLDLFGGYTTSPQRDSWRLVLGGQARLGCEYIASRCRRRTCSWYISKNAELLLFWAATRRPPPGAGAGNSPPPELLWTELGSGQIYIAPDCN